MLHRPYRLRDMDDDSAPVDYSYVPSVHEGQRRRQLQNIHQEARRPVVRHRADPEERERVDAYGTRAPREPVRAGKLPSAADGLPPATRIAYPEDTVIPDNPFAPQEEETLAARPGRGARIAVPEPEPIVAEDGSQFDPPAMAQLPEWYRVAQQNAMPRDDRRARAPRVEAAPRQDEPEGETDLLGRPLRGNAQRQARHGDKRPADVYEEAGYPPELLERQRAEDEARDVISRRRRHGAQYAVNASQQEEYQRSVNPADSRQAHRASYPPPREAGYATPRPRPRPQEPPYAPGDAAPGYSASGSYAPGDAAPSYSASSAYAPNPYAAPRGEPLASPPPRPVRQRAAYRVEDADDVPASRPRFQIPWLAVAIFALAGLAVTLWLLQLNYATQTERLQTERYQAEIRIKDKHPYEYRSLIEREAAKNNLDPAFVAAIVLNESSFRAQAESSVGARGLMQVMADTAEDIGRELNVANYSFDMLYDAETNVIFGCYYLGRLGQRFRGDPILAAAAYHAGAGEVQNWLNDSKYSLDGTSLVLENLADGPTKQYATRVKNDFAIYKRLYYETREGDA